MWIFQAFERCAHGKAEVAVVEFERFCKRRVHVGLLDVAFFDHASEHVLESRFSACERFLFAFFCALDERVVVERALDRTCNKCAFGKRQILEFLVKEVLRGDGDALART